MGNSSGAHIIQNTCEDNASIRNFYTWSIGRGPLVRADGYFHANNFTAGFQYEGLRIQPCTDATSPIASTITMGAINNFTVEDPNVINGMNGIKITDGTGCTNLNLHESGNRYMNDDHSLANCDNHGCVSNSPDAWITQAGLGSVYPAGYVAEPIANTTAGVLDFANQITTYAGARPTQRLPYVQSLVNEAINMVDGSGFLGDFNDRTTVVAEGGILQITPLPGSYDPTSSSDNPCGENMPTGSTADAIQSSGLTRLHEWVIGCFYDDVMPGGYREDKLQNYAAPGGGGSGPPPAQPNPPLLQAIS
jgi:hypothetical protein